MGVHRVLHIKGRLSSDGATAVEYGFAQELTPGTVFDWLLEEGPEEGWKKRFQQTGSHFFQVQYPKHGKKKVLLKYRAYRDFFREHPYDTVHIDTDGFHRVAELYAAKRAGIPRRILHSHSTIAEVSGRLGGSGFSRRLGQWLYTSLSTDCLACSEQAGEWLFGRKGKRPVTILKNGLDAERFRFDPQKREAIRKQLGWENQKVLGHVGRFEPPKNHRFLLSVFETLYERDSAYRLLLIGDGSLRWEILEEVRRKRLDAVVSCPGTIEQVESEYQAMDIFLFPSLAEGFGQVAVEAQCSGLPCLIADTVTRQAAVTADCVFLPVDQGPESWAAQVEKLFQNPGDRAQRAQEAICAAGSDRRNSAEKLREIYGG